MTASPSENDGFGPPIESGSIDAMIVNSALLSMMSWANATCGTEHHAGCLYDYTFDEYGSFGPHRPPVANILQTYLDPNATEPIDWPHVELTAPIYSSSLGGIVKVSPHERGMWRVFAPWYVLLLVRD